MKVSLRSVPGSLVILLIAWELFAMLYLLRMPPGSLSHDVRHHLQFTRIVYYEHRLPAPREGEETYQPPLYYLINSRLDVPSAHHLLWGCLLAMQFGLIALALIAWQMESMEGSTGPPLWILAFIFTSPTFLFVFASYNNDALATLLSIAILSTTMEMIRRKRLSLAVPLGVLITAGLYTKLSVLYAVGAAGILIAGKAIRGRISPRLAAGWIAAAIVAAALLLPWMIGHNYALTHRLLPSPTDEFFAGYEQVRLPHSALRTLLTPPISRPGEWRDPFAHGWGEDPITKKYSFTAYLFSTWIFDEFEFKYLPTLVVWMLVIVHGAAVLGGVAAARSTSVGRSALLLIATGVLLFSSLIFRYPYATLMHFRYVAWIWLPLAVIWSEASRSKGRSLPWVPQALTAVMILGIGLHLWLWFPLILSAPRWYY